MRHPPHAKDRCCRVCHAVAVTTPITDTDPANIPVSAAGIPPGWKDKGDGTRPLIDHYQYDRARKRKGAGLRQLHESTGERDF